MILLGGLITMAKTQLSARGESILRLLSSAGHLTVGEISRTLDVSTQAIRRELKVLEELGLLVRTYGGATIVDTSHPADLPQSSEDRSLSVTALSLINAGDVIAVDSSAFSISLAREIRLQELPITVLTSSLRVAQELAESPNTRLIVTGGIFRTTSQSLEGSLSLHALKAYRIQKAFLTCEGFTLQDGPTESDESQAEFKSVLMQQSNQTILAIPPFVVGKNALIPLCPLNSITWMVLLNPFPPHEMEALQTVGIKMLVDPFAGRKGSQK